MQGAALTPTAGEAEGRDPDFLTLLIADAHCPLRGVWSQVTLQRTRVLTLL